ncbi:MAG TPA: Asp-tRNA(Asn)/Glu-tRNA(Gln) amidotransferase subunit GatB [Nitrospira sp.]
MTYEVVIGVEVHAQLRTMSKMFCGCGTTFGLPANSQTCPVCLGLPGTLPVINKAAVEMAVRAGLALNCTIGANNRFARKNYFYPDLPKGYQISQYESPICEHGWIEIAVGDEKKRIRIRRAHLEEDAGKNIHETGTGGSRVDLNRAGTPLLEIVTEPDMRSADEVVAYLRSLRETLIYQDVCDGDMEKGNFRCEPNLSLRPLGQKALGTKVELKNINSFRFVKDAMEYEIKRQAKVLNEGGKIQQETRLWDTVRGETAVMRSKEEAHDYRYFPDPDLVPLRLSEDWVKEVEKSVRESSASRKSRIKETFRLSDYVSNLLGSDKSLLEYFEKTAAQAEKYELTEHEIGKELANCLTVDFQGLLNKLGHSEMTTSAFMPVPGPDWIAPGDLMELIAKKVKEEISGPTYKLVLEKMLGTGKTAASIIEAEGLKQVSDEGSIEKIIEEILVKHPAQVAQFKEGKQQVLGFLVGQVMKASGGTANPGKVNALLRRKLGG